MIVKYDEHGRIYFELEDDTVRSLRDNLQNNSGTRWYKLFGTPEKMAQTLAKALAECDEYGWHCDRCVYRLAPYCPRSTAGVASTADYDTLLEWLIGDEQHGDKAVGERDELIRDMWQRR